MNRRLAIFGLALAWIGMAGSAVAQDPVEAALVRLRRVLGDSKTLAASFVQEKHLRVLSRPMIMSGRIYVSRPDRLAWHVIQPIRYTLLMDGKTMRQWDAESDHEIRLSLDSNPALQIAADQIRQWFSGDYGRMRDGYVITLEAADPLTLRFTPKPGQPAAGYVDHVTAMFNEAERYLASLEIVEQGGDRTVIRFSEAKLDIAIPDSAWDLRATVQGE